jgi:AraC-like DNA-binding protein
MITSNYITHYLPAAIIALLLVVVAMLVWMLQQAVRKQRRLEVEIEQLQAKIQHEEKKDTGSKEEEERLNVTDEAQPDEMPDNVFVIHIDQLIARNIGKNDFTASTIAQVMHLSRSQLDRRMKQLAGKTATAYLLDRRMTYARELLLTTKMPVADVATACGFEDTSYFTRVFKQHYGNTPSGMRG